MNLFQILAERKITNEELEDMLESGNPAIFTQEVSQTVHKLCSREKRLSLSLATNLVTTVILCPRPTTVIGKPEKGFLFLSKTQRRIRI